MNKMRNKIMTLRLLMMMLLGIGTALCSTEVCFAYEERSSYQAMLDAVEVNGWTTIELGGKDVLYFSAADMFCTLHAPASPKGYYFAKWVTMPTCTTSGKAYMNCKAASDAGAGAYVQEQHHKEKTVSALGHKYTGEVKSSTYANDGYWYYQCAHCDTWEKKEATTYYINYNDTHITGQSTNGVTMDRSEHTYDVESNLSRNLFEKKGFRFLGWATSPTGDVIYADVDSVCNLTVIDSQIIDLYAVWEPTEFELVYHANGGEIESTMKRDDEGKVISGTGVSMISSIESYDKVIDLSIKGYKDGLNFVGWALAPDSSSCITSMNIPAGDVTLYAIYSLPVSDMKEAVLTVWEKNNESSYRSYNMNLDEIDSVNVYHYSLADIVASEGLNFTVTDDLEWNISLYDNAGNRTDLKEEKPPIKEKYLQTVAHYIWNIKENRYDFVTTKDESVEEGEVFTPQYLSVDDDDYPHGFEPASIDEPYVVTKDTTSSAYYDPIEYTLYFDANGGTCDIPSKKVYMNNIYDDLPDQNDTRKSGHDFIGWFTLPEGGEQVRRNDIYTTSGDSTVYAHWRVHSNYVIYNYWENGGSSATTQREFLDYGSTVDLSVTAAKDGWKFLGWHTNPSAKTGLSECTMPDGTLILYAIFSKDFTATFVDRSEEGIISRNKVITIYGKKNSGEVEIPKQNTWGKWECLGWRLDKEAQASMQISSGSTIPIDKDTTFYGCYRKKVTLSYDTNGSPTDLVEVTEDAYYNAADDYLEAEFTIENAPPYPNHSFVAWEELARGGTVLSTHVPEEKVKLIEDMHLTAKWDEYPKIEAYDRYFTLQEAQNGYITKSKLLEKVVAKDREDGVLINGTAVVVFNYDESIFLNMNETGVVEITYEATDNFGNAITKNVMVYVVDTTAKESPNIRYVRFINERFFLDEEGNTVSADMGGLEETSTWKTNMHRYRLLEDTLFNSKVDVETWVFKQENIKQMKDYTNTYGQVLKATDKFFELFSGCRQK